MARLALIALAGFLSLPATDSLTDRNAATLGSNWSAAIGAITDWSLTIAVGATTPVNGADFSVPFWNADTFNADQYSQANITVGSAGYEGLSVRGSSGNAYGVSLEGGACTFYKFVSSSRSTLGTCSSHSWTAGHTLKLEVIGDTLTVYDNGVSFGTVAGGSAVSSGKPGLLGYAELTQLWTTWQGDNTGGGGGNPLPPGLIINPIRCCNR